MLYQAYQAHEDVMAPLRRAAGRMALWPPAPLPGLPAGPLAAAFGLIARTGLTHQRPSFGIGRVTLGDREVEVRERTADRTPFASLLHFAKDEAGPQPRLLVVAPMSGHFATLLRGTVRTLLPDHDVYITDWHNARDVPPSEGSFDLDAFVLHLIRFLAVLGPDSHLLAICQPCVAALAAVALMAAEGHPAQPASLTLMAGPIDPRANPTEVNRFATSRRLDWFERHLIARVPARHPGGGRRVYPGFLQVGAFMAMNIDRHVRSHLELYRHMVSGAAEPAAAIRAFYDEYFAVMDLPAEFFLATVRDVFQDCTLPQGRMTVAGRPVEPRAIRRTALLTVEGERDDICAVGQTVAAQDLCTGLRPHLKQHHVQTGVGHYGVFSGKRWSGAVYPVLRDMIRFAR